MKALLGNIMFPSAIYLLLAVLQLLQKSCGATINIPPETKYANIFDNMTVTFYCKATGERTEWVIQNMRYSSQNQTIDGYIMREVKEDGTSMIIVHHMYLEVPATIEYNRTTVRCGVSVNQQLIFSDPVMLILQGGPAAPVPMLKMVNKSLIILRWEAPFTWNYTTIRHYNVYIHSSLNTWNWSNYMEEMIEFRATEDIPECTEFNFTVVASNEFGDGEMGTITGGFPITPQLTMNAITYTNLSPVLRLNITLPFFCGYQTVQYLIVVTKVESIPSGPRLVIEKGPYSQLYSEQQVVSVDIEYEELSGTGLFQVNLTVEFPEIEQSPTPMSVISMIDTRTTTTTIEDTTTTTTEDTTTTTTEDTTATTTAIGGLSETTGGLEMQQVIAVISGAVILLTLVFLVVLISVCKYRKRMRRRVCSISGRSPIKSTTMVTNPIYDGHPVYETIDPNFRSIDLAHNSGTTLDISPISTGMHPSPYSHYSVDPGYSQMLSPFPHPVEEQYTVMTSVGKVLSSSGESNLDQEASEVTRYVPEPSMLITEC